MDMGEIRGVITLLTFLAFLGVCWWAYRSSNRNRFEQDALLPFLDESRGDTMDQLGDSEGSDR